MKGGDEAAPSSLRRSARPGRVVVEVEGGRAQTLNRLTRGRRAALAGRRHSARPRRYRQPASARRLLPLPLAALLVVAAVRPAATRS